jgi:hypothetical protein
VPTVARPTVAVASPTRTIPMSPTVRWLFVLCRRYGAVGVRRYYRSACLHTGLVASTNLCNSLFTEKNKSRQVTVMHLSLKRTGPDRCFGSSCNSNQNYYFGHYQFNCMYGIYSDLRRSSRSRINGGGIVILVS